jgi:para-aminobenzoate synthetase component 1
VHTSLLPPSFATFRQRLNEYGRLRKPCLFLIDFEGHKPVLVDPNELNTRGIRFDFPGRADTGIRTGVVRPSPTVLTVAPPEPERYYRAFETVQLGLARGNSYLVNLTLPTPVGLTVGLEEVYYRSRAKYRIYFPGEFVCFSPETFVTISPEGYIETRPMKGTAPDTEAGRAQLLDSIKERAEHATIVDLLRNDLSKVAARVRVTDYRYLHAIDRGGGALVQTSSRIGGHLGEKWAGHLGDILAELLPAGSVSGAPKQATVDLIRRAEPDARGYYCGVAGYFDGQRLDSCVLIRYIEETGTQFLFRSGGGVTAMSDREEEYRELVAKIRIPIDRPILMPRQISV